MYLLFPHKDIVIANNMNLQLYHVKDVIEQNKHHLCNKWEKTDNPDGSFYLSFIDYRKQRYWLKNSGMHDVVGVKIDIGEKFLKKGDRFVYQGKNGMPTGFTLNIQEGYLSDVNIIGINDLESMYVILVDDL